MIIQENESAVQTQESSEQIVTTSHSSSSSSSTSSNNSSISHSSSSSRVTTNSNGQIIIWLFTQTSSQEGEASAEAHGFVTHNLDQGSVESSAQSTSWVNGVGAGSESTAIITTPEGSESSHKQVFVPGAFVSVGEAEVIAADGQLETHTIATVFDLSALQASPSDLESSPSSEEATAFNYLLGLHKDAILAGHLTQDDVINHGASEVDQSACFDAQFIEFNSNHLSALINEFMNLQLPWFQIVINHDSTLGSCELHTHHGDLEAYDWLLQFDASVLVPGCDLATTDNSSDALPAA